ncbi:MAG TPA: hypothetical protein VGD43_09640 [Micromonospora sp.]
MRGRGWAAVLLAMLAVLWGAAGHLETRPTDHRAYQETAARAASAAHDAVATAQLTGRADLAGRLYHRYVRSTLDDARDALAGAARQFASKTPPDPPTARLRDRLASQLTVASARLGDVQTAVDTGDRAALQRSVADLAPVVDQLAAFVEENQ